MKYAYVSLLNDDSSDFIYNIILALSLLKTKLKDVVAQQPNKAAFFKG